MKKVIVVEDLGKKIKSFPGRNMMRSPIKTPVTVTVNVVGQLIHNDKIERMYELDPKNYGNRNCKRVLLTSSNFSKSWDELTNVNDEVIPEDTIKIEIKEDSEIITEVVEVEEPKEEVVEVEEPKEEVKIEEEPKEETPEVVIEEEPKEETSEVVIEEEPKEETPEVVEKTKETVKKETKNVAPRRRKKKNK